tara:strand:+ start:509 stop:682 length:174 start_codon:yes stop_codon:yes gene_type:complete
MLIGVSFSSWDLTIAFQISKPLEIFKLLLTTSAVHFSSLILVSDFSQDNVVRKYFDS